MDVIKFTIPDVIIKAKASSQYTVEMIERRLEVLADIDEPCEEVLRETLFLERLLDRVRQEETADGK